MPVCSPSVIPDTGNEPESAAGGRLPLTRAKWATVAQVAAIAAGVLAMASGLLMWRIVGYTAANLDTGVSFEPNSITNWSVLLSLAPAGAGALAAVLALTLRGRARWLRYLQIGLWVLTLASSAYIADTCAPLIGLGPLYGPLAVADISAVAAIALLTLTLSLRRPVSRQPRWRLAFVLLAAAMPAIAIAARRRPDGLWHPHRNRLAMPAGPRSLPGRDRVRAKPGRADRSLPAPAIHDVGSPLPHKTADGDLFDQCRHSVGRQRRRHGVRPGGPDK